MRRESEPLPQLRFGLALALSDLVAEHPDADSQPVEPVLQAVDGERLGRTATPDHRVDRGPGPGDEPEPAPHAAESRAGSSAAIAARCRAAHSPRTSRSSARRCLRERLTSWRMWNRIRLRVSGASARRSPWNSDAVCTTVSLSTRSAKTGAARVATGSVTAGSPILVMTYSTVSVA